MDLGNCWSDNASSLVLEGLQDQVGIDTYHLTIDCSIGWIERETK